MSAPCAPRRRWPTAPAALVAGCASALWAPPARAADRAVEQGVIAYETGRFAECVQKFQGVLQPGSPDAPTTQESRSRARMYLATCLATLKREAEADAVLETLVREDYRFSPDRAAFPVTVIGRFLDTQLRLAPEVEAKVRADQEREARLRYLQEERERIVRERQQINAQMARGRVTGRRSSRLVALVPFGVGQFQNGQRTLGWTLLGTEAALAAASAVTFFLKDNIERQFSSGVDRTEALRLRDLAVQANYVTFGLFAATALGGVAHAQLTFVPEFREVRERPLPPPVSVPTGGVSTGGLLSGGLLTWRGTW